MRKKLVLALLMATLIAGGAFAQFTISAGLGGAFSADFISLVWPQDNDAASDLLDHLGGQKDLYDMNIIGGGFYAYFDATYVMLSLGMGYKDIKYMNANTREAMGDMKMSLTTFDISLYGKYPVPVGKVTTFPLLGVELRIAVAWDIDGEKVSGYPGTMGKNWNTIWFKFGFGVDIPLSGKLYLRPMFLYGFGTVPKFYQDLLDGSLNAGRKLADAVVQGIDVKLAIGYRF